MMGKMGRLRCIRSTTSESIQSNGTKAFCYPQTSISIVFTSFLQSLYRLCKKYVVISGAGRYLYAELIYNQCCVSCIIRRLQRGRKEGSLNKIDVWLELQNVRKQRLYSDSVGGKMGPAQYCGGRRWFCCCGRINRLLTNECSEGACRATARTTTR